jgi:hypothetical protein
MVPEQHALREFFLELVDRHFSEDGLHDEEMVHYVSTVLTDFCEQDELFKVRDAHGRPITAVGEMLLEADPVYGPAPSFDRERQVRKHIGDYTLFFTGLFPERGNAGAQTRGFRNQHLDSVVDFIRAGKESYYIVSQFNIFEYAKVAPLFMRLSQEFERCVHGLNTARRELDHMQYPLEIRSPKLLM